jgi:patatin-like phospholipase/acyl hydrolase
MMATDTAQFAEIPSATLQETNDGHNLDNTGHCLLALDGGGVRGLSSLFILENIVEQLNFVRKEAGLQPRKPCELFDLIGGTSTGGYVESERVASGTNQSDAYQS